MSSRRPLARFGMSPPNHSEGAMGMPVIAQPRVQVLSTVGLLLIALAAPSAKRERPLFNLTAELKRIAASAPGTLGAAVIDVESGAGASVNASGWFPMM